MEKNSVGESMTYRLYINRKSPKIYTRLDNLLHYMNIKILAEQTRDDMIVIKHNDTLDMDETLFIYTGQECYNDYKKWLENVDKYLCGLTCTELKADIIDLDNDKHRTR